MELVVIGGLVVGIVVAIVIASFISREKPKDDPPDLAAGSNKPDDRNAFGPEGKN
jgi:hypothetical protein